VPSKRAVVRVLSIVLVALAAACDKQEDSPIKDIQNDPKFRYQNGLSALRAGNPDRAVRDLEVARTLDPKNVDVLHALGLALSESGNSARAIEVLTEAIELSPKNPALLNSRGVVLSRARRFDDAIADFQAALAPEAHYATPEAALLNLADAYTETQRFAEAIETLEKGRALRPRSGAIETALCRTYDRAGRLEDAHRTCQQAVLDEPTYAAGYFELGKIELRRGRNAEALSAFEKCLKLEPRGETAEQARRYRTLLAPDAPAMPASAAPPPAGGATPEAASPR
jgi:Flp pilus assembly protein TadD